MVICTGPMDCENRRLLIVSRLGRYRQPRDKLGAPRGTARAIVNARRSMVRLDGPRSEKRDNLRRRPRGRSLRPAPRLIPELCPPNHAPGGTSEPCASKTVSLEPCPPSGVPPGTVLSAVPPSPVSRARTLSHAPQALPSNSAPESVCPEPCPRAAPPEARASLRPRPPEPFSLPSPTAAP